MTDFHSSIKIMATSHPAVLFHPLDQNNNKSGTSSGMKKINSKNYEKYSLRPRSIQKRIETEKRAKEPKKVPKPKLKAPPLSKYRRKTANARERSRMQEINFAFDTLQSVVPQYPILPVNAQGKTCEKLTKITTLRLAMNYISALNKLLSDESSPSDGLTVPSPAISGDEHFISLSPAGSASITSTVSSIAEFSPASSSSSGGFSPGPNLQPPPTPDCLQTVMRSIVLPPPTTGRRTSIRNRGTPNINFQPPISSSSSSGMLPSSYISNPYLLPIPSLSPSNSSHLMSSSGLRMPTNPVRFHPSIDPSMSSSRLFTGSKSPCEGTRTGSLSSLTESDLSEYTSDLLSDEGSSLDDPMFDDIIGVDSGVCGTMDDLDHLILNSDVDIHHFSTSSSGFSEN